MALQQVDSMKLLGKDNFETWKVQMQAVLVIYDLWEFVLGEKPQRKTRALYERGIRTIKRRREKSSYEHITEFENWEKKMKELHQSSGPAWKATMLKKLMKYKMTDDEDVRDYLANFFQTTDRLRLETWTSRKIY